MDDELKLSEVARELRVCKRTVYNWIREGRLPAKQNCTGRWWIRREDLEAVKPQLKKLP